MTEQHSAITKLYCGKGGSNKVYNVEPFRDYENGGWSVFFEYGARNRTTLSEGYKVQNVGFVTARKTYDKLIASKKDPRKGYEDITTKFDIVEFRVKLDKRIVDWFERTEIF